MDPGEQPEADKSELLDPDAIRQYQMLLGCAQWAVSLGRFDIQFATNTLARYALCPRANHMKMALRIFGYLKQHPTASTWIDPTKIDYGGVEFEQNKWHDIYPDAKEDLPTNGLQPKHKGELQILVFVDASHGNDVITRRSVTGFVIMIGHTPIVTYSKQQNTVELSTYGSKLMAARIALESLLGIWYKLRMMGIRFEGCTPVLCNNKAVVTNMKLPSSNLKNVEVHVT